MNPLDGRTVLFRTQHGSRLYGTARPDSDLDLYVVVAKIPHARANWSRQTIVGDIDTTVIDLGTFLHQCTLGVPQALEAMFAPSTDVDLIRGLREGWRVGTGVWPTYRRTIRSFIEAGDPKRRVHALRLALNIREARARGRFDPVLRQDQVMWIRDAAEGLDDEGLTTLAEAVAFG